MAHINVTQITSETAQLVAYQVGRVYALKTRRFKVGKPETRLNVVCAKLAMQRTKFSSSIRPYIMPRELLRETAEVGGPRWRIGWGGIS
jgi:hypothetical protein